MIKFDGVKRFKHDDEIFLINLIFNLSSDVDSWEGVDPIWQTETHDQN